jgi:hypothetical protein
LILQTPEVRQHLRCGLAGCPRERAGWFEADGQEIHACAGATVLAPRGSRHTFQNIGSTPGRTITAVVPGGLDIFFEELETTAPRGTVPDPAKLSQICEKHGQELLGRRMAIS